MQSRSSKSIQRHDIGQDCVTHNPQAVLKCRDSSTGTLHRLMSYYQSVTTQPGLCPRTPPKGFCRSQYQIRFVSRTTSPLCHFVTFPLSMNGEGNLYVAFDLLSVPSIRTIHRTVLISAPLESTIIYCFFITFRSPSQLISRWGPSPIPNETVTFSYVSRVEKHNQ